MIGSHGHLRVVHGAVRVAADLSGVKGRFATGLRPETLDTAQISGWWGVMNDPEVTMLEPTRRKDLVAYSKALETAGLALLIAKGVPAPLRSLADQLVRAASSVPANLAEGHGRFGRDRMQHWRIAYGSAKEVDCHLRLLTLAGALDRQRAETALRLFDEIRAMTWRLLHPKTG